jgi:hypothetical protein
MSTQRNYAAERRAKAARLAANSEADPIRRILLRREQYVAEVEALTEHQLTRYYAMADVGGVLHPEALEFALDAGD